MRFKNKIVLITGASRGIGEATALEFAKEGAKVVVNYREARGRAEKVLEEIKRLGGQAIAIKADVSQESDVKEMIERTVSEFGRIDILVNNAGIVFDVPFKDRTVEHWKQTLNVNLIGVFICAKYASQQMQKQGSGCIVNVSSTNGIDFFHPDSMDYDASKAGVVMLTRDLAKELAPVIRVTSVAPGWVNTEMNKDLPADYVKEETDDIYMKRFCEPKEIARTILFLASDDASYITGTTLKVDGGHG